MAQLARFLQMLALGVWVGALVCFGAIVAPVLFAVLPGRDLAGAAVASILPRLHWLGLGAGAVFLGVGWWAQRQWSAVWRTGGHVVLLMMLLTLLSQYALLRPMERLRQQMGSVEHASWADPARQRFGHLHTVSVRVEGLVLLLGLVGLYLRSR